RGQLARLAGEAQPEAAERDADQQAGEDQQQATPAQALRRDRADRQEQEDRQRQLAAMTGRRSPGGTTRGPRLHPTRPALPHSYPNSPRDERWRGRPMRPAAPVVAARAQL